MTTTLLPPLENEAWKSRKPGTRGTFVSTAKIDGAPGQVKDGSVP